MFDIVIKNGLIADGTGKSIYKGDLGIKDGEIVEIKERINEPCNKIVDVEGLIVSPGFVDVHSHNDLVPFMDEEIQNLKLYQGVTTELVGQCGLGVVPCVEREKPIWKDYIKGIVGCPNIEFNFHSMKEYFSKIKKVGLKNNICALISHGAIRTQVMNFQSRPATEYEINQMCQIVDKAMDEGALGMSLGLQYMPGIFSTKDELIALCKVIKEHNGIVMVHLRNHDRNIVKAMEDVIEIANKSKVKLHISHMKSYASKELGCPYEVLIKIVEKAKEEGIDITFDEHLYLSGSTLLTQLLPPWLTDKGREKLMDMLKNERVLQKVKLELSDLNTNYIGWDNYSLIAGWDGIMITSLNKPANKKYIGRCIGEISRELNMHPVDFMARLLIDEKTGVGIVTLNIFSEEDTIKYIKHPLQMVGSDSIPAGEPHPRLYGNYPLFIGKFVRDKKALTLEEAVYKATLFPAKTLGLENIGQISKGKTADLTIFDFKTINGFEDYKNSRKKPVGIKFVILNGKIVMEDGRILKGKYGKIL